MKYACYLVGVVWRLSGETRNEYFGQNFPAIVSDAVGVDHNIQCGM